MNDEICFVAARKFGGQPRHEMVFVRHIDEIPKEEPICLPGDGAKPYKPAPATRKELYECRSCGRQVRK